MDQYYSSSSRAAKGSRYDRDYYNRQTAPNYEAYFSPSYTPPVMYQPGSRGYNASKSNTEYVSTPSDYFILSLCALCCFWPIGCFAIFKSRKVYQSIAEGDLEGAKIASRTAKRLGIAAIVVEILSFVIGVIAIIVVYTVGVPAVVRATTTNFS